MAVTSSAPISITDLVTEFGGSTPHALTEYYRGGSLVPNTTTNASVPTSGAISLTDFFGSSSVTNWTTVVTVGVVSGFFTQSGFSATAFGSLSDTTVDFLDGTPTVSRIEFASISQSPIFFKINGSENTGWTSIQIGSLTLAKSSATSFSDGLWRWDSQSNPFGSDGTETTVVLTQ
tara:strand:- start:132 stop:659 length:528 start_codon:yes stop_codon:yes gene_type:complete